MVEQQLDVAQAIREYRGLYDAAPEMLEALIDRIGLADVLGLMAEVCGDKAEHLVMNWQDFAAARSWEKVGVSVGIAATRAAKLLGDES